ncbi:MAG: phosphocholine cytidylyltransferase family protein [Candidatus Aminicenantes bacterium]|nr:phosphocholine cytidylyltransferase family protein [Candidatus Aminicenantes bacterium]
MKALILASGTAQRLRPLTDNQPKCLVKINGESILERLLEQFTRAGIGAVVITTGPFEEQVLEAVAPFRAALDITTVKNEIYDKTNYIYSIYKAREELKDDILLVHGDLVFADRVLTKLLQSKHKNSVIVKKDFRPPKDFKARIKDNRVLEISTKISGPETHFLAPLYRFAAADFQLWSAGIDDYIKRQEVHCYAENALNELLPAAVELNPVYIGEEICLEIDDFADLEECRALLDLS